MRVYWLTALPLAGSAVAFLLPRRLRLYTAALALVTTLACARLALLMPLDNSIWFLGQQWMLDQAGQSLLAFLYVATAIIIAVAVVAEQAEWFSPPVLASCGLLSAAVVLRSALLSFMLLPAALLVLPLGTLPSSRGAVRGATRFLIWVALPILCIPVAITMLQRGAPTPEQPGLTELSAWLVVPPAIMWWTLFPFDGTTRLWSRDQLSVTSAFLWTVKDWVIVYLLLALWRQYPLLYTQDVAGVLSIAGLGTAVFSGSLAFAQSNLSAVLACAAVSELGIAVQGISAGSVDGVAGGLFLLLSRSAAVLLASSALAATGSAFARDAESNASSYRWRRVIVWVGLAVGILAMAGLPPLGGFSARRQIYAALQPENRYLLLAWLSATAGIVLGLVRTGWSLWHAKAAPSSEPLHDLPVVLVLCLLLLCLWIGLRPQATVRLLSELFRDLLPLT